MRGKAGAGHEGGKGGGGVTWHRQGSPAGDGGGGGVQPNVVDASAARGKRHERVPAQPSEQAMAQGGRGSGARKGGGRARCSWPGERRGAALGAWAHRKKC